MAGRTTLLVRGDPRLTLVVYVGGLSAGPCGTAVFKLSRSCGVQVTRKIRTEQGIELFI